MPGIQISRSTANGLTVVALAGELDVSAAPALRRELQRSAEAALPDLAVDLTRVEFMDCAIVGVLVRALTVVKAHGGCLRLYGVGDAPRRLMELCRLDGVLCLHDSAESASAVPCHRHAHA
jgi:anti-sigma B factor antagonist